MGGSSFLYLKIPGQKYPSEVSKLVKVLLTSQTVYATQFPSSAIWSATVNTLLWDDKLLRQSYWFPIHKCNIILSKLSKQSYSPRNITAERKPIALVHCPTKSSEQRQSSDNLIWVLFFLLHYKNTSRRLFTWEVGSLGRSLT